jgi:DNA-binding response OmpR family regulator
MTYNRISGGELNELVLVIDDEPKIVKLAQDYLERSNFQVVPAYNGLDALSVFRQKKPNFIILDLGLPGMDGIDVARTIRKESNVPIIILTARSEETDKLIGLELGADDYIVKPFSPKELVARVRAVLRRVENNTSDREVIRVSDITLDIPRQKLTVGEKQIELTNTEFQLLTTLMKRPGQIFARAQLMDSIHGVMIESYERAVDSHIKNLRRKIEADPNHPIYILTVYGVGYKFTEGN